MGFTLTGEHGKLWRSCGDCTDNGGPRNVVIDNVKVNAKIGSIVGVNRNYGDTATITNLKIKNYKSGSPKVCVEYKGVKKVQVAPQNMVNIGILKNCNVSKSDVTKL
ncbi:pectate lyase [Vibrio sp. PP-XX7]